MRRCSDGGDKSSIVAKSPSYRQFTMAPTTSSYKTRRYTKFARRHKSFFAGTWHYGPVPKESSNPRKGREGQQRARILSREWLARHDNYTTKKSLQSAGIEDSHWAYSSDFGDYDLEDPETSDIIQSARRKKNIDNRASRKKNWDTVLPYITRALRGHTIENTHTKECSLQPREILFVDCTCKETTLTYTFAFLTRF
jgi:hypothetical protein